MVLAIGVVITQRNAFLRAGAGSAIAPDTAQPRAGERLLACGGQRNHHTSYSGNPERVGAANSPEGAICCAWRPTWTR